MTAITATIEDLRNQMPQFGLTATSTPNEAQAQGYIDQIESEIRALVLGYDGPWPPLAGSPGADFVKLTVLEGARWLVLRARYEMSKGSAVPEIALEQARLAYNDRKRDLAGVVEGMIRETWQNATPDPAINYPVIGDQTDAPTQAGDLYDYTRRRQLTADRWGGWGRLIRPEV